MFGSGIDLHNGLHVEFETHVDPYFDIRCLFLIALFIADEGEKSRPVDKLDPVQGEKSCKMSAACKPNWSGS